MNTNVVTFTKTSHTPANDDHPTSPGGTVVSLSVILRKTRVVRTLRGVALVDGGVGVAQAA